MSPESHPYYNSTTWWSISFIYAVVNGIVLYGIKDEGDLFLLACILSGFYWLNRCADYFIPGDSWAK